MAHVTLTVQPGQQVDEASRIDYKKTPSYSELRELVGGFIETIPHLTSLSYKGKRIRCMAFVDEEGQLKRLPRNDMMSATWVDEMIRKEPKASFWYEPQLFGPVVIVVNANQLK